MKKIFKTIGLICMAVVVAAGSIFVTKKQTQNEINVASAGNNLYNSSSFSSGDLFIPNAFFKSVNSILSPVLKYDYFGFSISTNLDNEGNILSYNFSPYLFYYYDEGGTIITEPLQSCLGEWGSSLSSYSDNASYEIKSGVNYYFKFKYSSSYFAPFLIRVNNGFNCNVSYLFCNYSPSSNDFYSISINKFLTYNGKYLNSDAISQCCKYDFSFKDTEGNSLLISSAGFSGLSINSDTLFYSTDLSSFSDDLIYSLGYNNGLADNQQNIYNQGYLAGRNVGYGEGHTAGLSDSNNYSFTGLIGAVFDVPLNTFKSLFNFNLLGINLFDFACSILTIAIIIYIIRLIKGGK